MNRNGTGDSVGTANADCARDVYALLAASGDLSFVCRADGRLARWGDSLPAMTDYGPDELEALSASSLFMPADRARVREARAEAEEAGQSVEVKARLRTKAGVSIPVALTTVPLHSDETEGTVAVVGQQRAGSARSEALASGVEAHFDALFEGVQEAAFLLKEASDDLEPAYVLVRANSPFEALVGQSVSGKGVYDPEGSSDPTPERPWPVMPSDAVFDSARSLIKRRIPQPRSARSESFE